MTQTMKRNQALTDKQRLTTNIALAKVRKLETKYGDMRVGSRQHAAFLKEVQRTLTPEENILWVHSIFESRGAGEFSESMHR
jgi:hypothetical protein